MNYQADFVEGTVLFSEVAPSPPNLQHLQGAMFLDRPDLWPSKRRRRNGKPVPPEQQPLFKPEQVAGGSASVTTPIDEKYCKLCDNIQLEVNTMNKHYMPSTWEAVLRDNQWTILGQDKSVVATLHGKTNNETSAKLIAASPYMLEALKALADLIGDEDLPDNGELSGAAICDMVRAAVALASGNSYP